VKIQRLPIILPILSLATLLVLSSQPSYGQRFSFGGKSQGKSRSGSLTRQGGSLGFKNSLGQSASKSKSSGAVSKGFANRTTTIKNLIGNRNVSSKGFPSQGGSVNRGGTSRGRLGGLKSKIGELTGGNKSTVIRDRDNRLGKWTDAIKGGIGRSTPDATKNGNLGHLLSRIHDNRKHNKICISNQNWCHTKPKQCHWWYDWCREIRYCEPVHQVHCGWQYVNCDDARWYLGLKGLFLPGRGIGIEEVSPGSPAAVVGLQPGMVITRCNGVDLVDETALNHVIEQSHGVLRMDLLLGGDQAPATCVVVMQRVSSISF
jgi:hypothetical protein